MSQSRAFAKFVSFFMKNPDTRKIEHEFAIDTAINGLTRNELIAAQKDLKHLLTGSYSNKDLTKIWSHYHPQFAYLGDTQRIFMQEVYDTVEGVLADPKRSFIPDRK